MRDKQCYSYILLSITFSKAVQVEQTVWSSMILGSSISILEKKAPLSCSVVSKQRNLCLLPEYLGGTLVLSKVVGGRFCQFLSDDVMHSAFCTPRLQNQDLVAQSEVSEKVVKLPQLQSQVGSEHV